MTTMEIQQLKIKRMLDTLDTVEGNGTSMISILVPSKGDLNRIKQKITDECTAANNIKSRL